MPTFLPIQWRLAELMGKGAWEQAYVELEMWAAGNPGPATEALALHFRAQILSLQFGPSETVIQLLREAFHQARHLAPGQRGAILGDLLGQTQYRGDARMLRVARSAWFRLQRRHGSDPDLKHIYPYVCSFLGQFSVGMGQHGAAVTWFDRAVASPEELEDETFASWCLALGAHACIKRRLLAEAAARLERAEPFVPESLHAYGLVQCVRAELALAEGHLEAAIALVSEVRRPNGYQQVNVLAACTTARIYGALGSAELRQRWTEEARKALEPHPMFWLQREVDLLQAH